MRTKRYMKCTSLLGLALLVATVFACGKQTPEGPKPAPKTPTAVTGAQKTVAIPDPPPLTVPDLAVAVRVNRFDQLLPKVAALASQIMPSITADALKAQLGAAVQDPTLAGLDQTRSAMLCVFDPPGRREADPTGSREPVVVGLLPVTSDQYKTKLQGMPNTYVYQKEGGKTLLLAQNEAAAVSGRQALDQLDPLLAQPMNSDLSVYVNVELLMTRHAADIEAAFKQMTEMMEQIQQMGPPRGGPDTTFFTMLMRCLLGVGKEVRDLGVDLTLTKDGLELGGTSRAKAGTALAKALDQPIVPDTSLLAYVPGTGSIIGFDGGDNFKAADYFAAKLDEAFAATTGPAASKIKVADIKAAMVEPMRLSRATAFDILGTSGGTINGVSIVEITDPAAYLNTLRNTAKNMKAMGTDATVAFKENARNYKGTPIHQMVLDINIPQQAEMPPFMAPILKALTHMESEIAVVGNYVIQDMGGKRIDAVIDALKAKKPLWTPSLNAQAIFPKEGTLYMDILPGRLVAWGVQVAQPFLGPMLSAMGPEGEAMLARFKTLQTKPISIYGAVNQGKVQLRINVPIDPVIKIKALFAMPGPGATPPKPL